MKKIKIFAVSAVLSMVGLAFPVTANAGLSVGAGVTCDPSMTHCVSTQASAYGAGSTVTGGKVVAVCKAEAPGALLVSVSCTVEGRTETVSLPGSNGASVVQANTNKIAGHEVCWNSTGFFTAVVGPAIAVTDTGCAVVTL